MTNPETNSPDEKDLDKKDRKVMDNKKIIAFALEFGFMIVLPLLIFAFAGKWLSHKYNNLGFFYGAIVLALITSVMWFWKRITDIYNDFIK